MSDALPQSFLDFIAPGIDRFRLLCEMLRTRGFAPSTVEIAGSRHIVISPEGALRKGGRTTVLVAHYDRADGSPGANDNSAAVFQLAAAAARLRVEDAKDWLIVFTDREECAGSNGARGQGAYALAEGFKAIGLSDSRFFIFDACGRGDTVIVSTTVDALAADAERVRKRARGLRLSALETGRTAAGGRIMLAPTPFSDDAGFLAAGIAAQTITVLPETEAGMLAGGFRYKREHAASLINRTARDELGPETYRELIPETWKLLHGPFDDARSLSPGSFPLMERFAHDLVVR